MLSLQMLSWSFWGAALMACVAPGAQAQVTLRLEALENPVLIGRSLVGSHGPATKDIDISLGDVLGLGLVLENEADVESRPMSLSLGRQIAVIVHPDGRESLSMMDDPLRRMAPPPVRPMKPHERLEATLYAYTDYAAEIDGRLEYIFSEQGEYHVYVAYAYRRPPAPEENAEPLELMDHSASEGERIVARVLHYIKHHDTHIVSNTIRVNVGPPFPGWEELREAGIVGAVRGVGEFAAIRPERNVNWRAEMERMDDLVAQADRPWLSDFYQTRIEAVLQEAQK